MELGLLILLPKSEQDGTKLTHARPERALSMKIVIITSCSNDPQLKDC